MTAVAKPVFESRAGHFFELLLIAGHMFAVEMQAALRFDEMSTLQLVALRIIARAPAPMTAKTLAAQIGCTRQSTTQLIQRLVRDGFADRVIDDDDRRAKLIIPTDVGLRAAQLAEDAIDRCARSFTRSFTVEEWTLFATFLERLEHGAQWHRTERYWEVHGSSGAGPRGRTTIHVR
jgi:DNA-binding MarR family transcriptional regulator